MPEPWSSVLAGLTGPYGVIVALGVVVYFLWRLLREEQTENRANFVRVERLAGSVELMTTEIRAWRESVRPQPRARS